MIPFNNIKPQNDEVKDELFALFNEVYESGQFSGGNYVEQFEKDFSRFCSTKYAVGCNNGTNALHLALRAMNIGKGDEVILPANTFIATAWAISYVGATPVFVDCDKETWQISIEDLEKKINNKTKLVIGVHLFGALCDLDEIDRVCSQYNIPFIEDAAQAQGAQYKYQLAGSIGDVGCFSFYPGKNLGTTGDAGAITTNSLEIAEKSKELRNHGSKIRYQHDTLGYNMRMGGLEAATLIVKLKRLNDWNSKRVKIAQFYHQNISNPKVSKQRFLENTSSVHHLYPVLVNDREAFMDYLKKNGVLTGIHYPIPCHLQKAYNHLNHKQGDFPNAESFSSHCVSLPMYPHLSEEETHKIVELVNQF